MQGTVTKIGESGDGASRRLNPVHSALGLTSQPVQPRASLHLSSPCLAQPAAADEVPARHTALYSHKGIMATQAFLG